MRGTQHQVENTVATKDNLKGTFWGVLQSGRGLKGPRTRKTSLNKKVATGPALPSPQKRCVRDQISQLPSIHLGNLPRFQCDKNLTTNRYTELRPAHLEWMQRPALPAQKRLAGVQLCHLETLQSRGAFVLWAKNSQLRM